MPAIEISNLTKTYENGVRALDDLSFHVPSGSVFGFLGLNGAGKSTTLRILAGLMRADTGAVRLFGNDVRLHDAMVLCQESENQVLKARTLERLSYVYSRIDREKAIEYARQAQDLGVLTGNKNIEALGLARIAWLERPASQRP